MMTPEALNFPQFFVCTCGQEGCTYPPRHTPILMLPLDGSPNPLMFLMGLPRCDACQAKTTVVDLMDQRGRDEILQVLITIVPRLNPASLQWDSAWLKWEPMHSVS
jgi:hypothetical protein